MMLLLKHGLSSAAGNVNEKAKKFDKMQPKKELKLGKLQCVLI